MVEAAVKTAGGTLVPATAADAAVLEGLKAGVYRVRLTRMSGRSHRHHKLFFGGLLPLAFQYWQPSGGMLAAGEREAVLGFARRLEALHDSGGLFVGFAEEFLAAVAAKRAERLGSAGCDMEVFRRWLTVEAGFFEVFETPSGLRKEPVSISFAAMGQEEFDVFYRACFQVAWNLLLRGRFENEEAALRAAEELMEFGS